MNRRVRSIPFLFLFLLHPPSTAVAQWDDGISLAAGTHALTVPWYPGPVAGRFNPAVLVGVDHTWKPRGNWRVYYSVNLSFFQHHWWMTGISVEPVIGISRELAGGVYVQTGLGAGYLHYFWRRKTMELKDGGWVQATDLGRPSLVLPLSLTLGYRGSRDNPVSMAPFLTARWGAQVLFQDEIPVMTHLQLMGGIRIRRGGSRQGGGG